ncbi:hypothetical protein Tco_0294441 [Tanacetum coccineum]
MSNMVSQTMGARGGVVSGGSVVFGVVRSSLGENPDGVKGVVGGESRSVEGGVTWHFEDQKLAGICCSNGDEEATEKDVYL